MNTIVLLAIEQEAPALVGVPGVYFTGVGKVNAAITATALIMQHRPRHIINFGTAGGITVRPGFYQCTRFVQRDMLCQGLGFAPGATPFETSVYLGHDAALTCSTGDDFVMNPNLSIPADVVDMEAYAIAKVCLKYQVNFECWKYISDQANHDANSEWQQHVSQGQQHYIARLHDLGVL